METSNLRQRLDLGNFGSCWVWEVDGISWRIGDQKTDFLYVSIYITTLGVQHVRRDDWLKDGFCGIFFGIDLESHHSKGPLWCFVFVYIFFRWQAVNSSYDTLQVRRQTSWKSSVQLFNGSDLESQTCVNLVQYVSSPFCLTSPYHLFLFHISTRWGSTPWPLDGKKPRCFGITEAYIDTVLSSKEFITSAQNAHGFLLAENGKVWVMFFGGASRGATNTLGVGLNCGWVWGGKKGRIIFGVSVCWHREFWVFDEKSINSSTWRWLEDYWISWGFLMASFQVLCSFSGGKVMTTYSSYNSSEWQHTAPKTYKKATVWLDFDYTWIYLPPVLVGIS